MAEQARALPGVGVFVPWLTFGAILAAALFIVFVSTAGSAVLDAATTAAARNGLSRLVHGDPLLSLAEIRGLASVSMVLLLQPLAVLGLMLLIELAAGPRDRASKNYKLAWMVQAAFLGFAAVLNHAVTKASPLPWRPLVEMGATDGLASTLFITLPMYLLALFVSDFFIYWLHRAQHRFAILWRFHAVHHSPRDMDVLHNITHPIETMGSLIAVALPTSLLIGVNSGQLFVLTAFIGVQSYVHHMNVPMHFGRLGWLFVDNRYHFIHHGIERAQSNTNFASYFPIIDRLFGTWQAPQPGPLPPTGLASGQPASLSHYLLGRWPGHKV
ncbi:MAG TPA: sterol desaturase family protein [Allosphingosinicella sp.]|jgi:sterol desaturase/sphingolipid hydroxylase (fatty acid hydroxylase superfamily)